MKYLLGNIFNSVKPNPPFPNTQPFLTNPLLLLIPVSYFAVSNLNNIGMT